MIATNTAMRSEEVFIASITTACHCRQFVAIREKSRPLLSTRLQERVTRAQLSKRSNVCLGSAGLRSEDGTYEASRIV